MSKSCTITINLTVTREIGGADPVLLANRLCSIAELAIQEELAALKASLIDHATGVAIENVSVDRLNRAMADTNELSPVLAQPHLMSPGYL